MVFFRSCRSCSPLVSAVLVSDTKQIQAPKLSSRLNTVLMGQATKKSKQVHLSPPTKPKQVKYSKVKLKLLSKVQVLRVYFLISFSIYLFVSVSSSKLPHNGFGLGVRAGFQGTKLSTQQ